MVTHRRFELRTIALKVRCSTGWASESLAGVAGFEPTNARIKIWCLTAWRYPYNAVYLITKTKFLQQIYCTFSTIAKLFCSWPINISTYQKVWYQCGVNSGIAPFDLCLRFRTTQVHIYARTITEGLHFHAGAVKQFTGLFDFLPVRIQ